MKSNLFTLLLLLFFLPVALLGQIYGEDNPEKFVISISNVQPELPFNNYLLFSLKFSGFSYDSFDYYNYKAAKTSMDGINNLFVSYEILLKDYFGLYGELQMKDYEGTSLFLGADYRSGKNGFVKDDAAFFARLGVKLLKADFHDNIKALISFSIGKGNLFSSFFRLSIDGFFFVPWVPGYIVQNDTAYHFEGQWRFGSLGLLLKISKIGREEDGNLTIYKNFLNEVVFGLPIFGKDSSRFLVYLKHQDKERFEYIFTGNDYHDYERTRRETLFAGLDFSGSYRTKGGKLFGYSFGVEFVIEQRYWEDGFSDMQTIDEMEMSFYWSGSFSL